MDLDAILSMEPQEVAHAALDEPAEQGPQPLEHSAVPAASAAAPAVIMRPAKLTAAAAANSAYEAAIGLPRIVAEPLGIVVAAAGFASLVHDSHVLAQHRGATWCWKCGGWTKAIMGAKIRAKALLNKCIAPTREGEMVLSRLRRGLPPSSHLPKRWPDEEEPKATKRAAKAEAQGNKMAKR